LKVFHVRDGHGIKQLLNAGIEVAIISGRQSQSVAKRAAELGIRHVYQGVDDKGLVLQKLLEQLSLPASAAACLVDDTPDLPMMAIVGLPIAVADAHPSVLRAAAWTTLAPGGGGAAREVADRLLGTT
jgi:3-deoxy-D-manno-octulosonate 8-phosphate phosphatase (KDO 8-P phosphatase)